MNLGKKKGFIHQTYRQDITLKRQSFFRVLLYVFFVFFLAFVAGYFTFKKTDEPIKSGEPHPVFKKKELAESGAKKKKRKYSSIKKRFPKYWEDIVTISLANGVSPYVTAAIIEHESRGKLYARGSKGDASLMQVMPYHFKKGENPYDAKTNISKGVSFLRKCMDIEGKNSARVLSCYNAGPNRKTRRMTSYENSVIKKLNIFLADLN